MNKSNILKPGIERKRKLNNDKGILQNRNF